MDVVMARTPRRRPPFPPFQQIPTVAPAPLSPLSPTRPRLRGARAALPDGGVAAGAYPPALYLDARSLSPLSLRSLPLVYPLPLSLSMAQHHSLSIVCNAKQQKFAGVPEDY